MDRETLLKEILIIAGENNDSPQAKDLINLYKKTFMSPNQDTIFINLCSSFIDYVIMNMMRSNSIPGLYELFHVYVILRAIRDLSNDEFMYGFLDAVGVSINGKSGDEFEYSFNLGSWHFMLNVLISGGLVYHRTTYRDKKDLMPKNATIEITHLADVFIAAFEVGHDLSKQDATKKLVEVKLLYGKDNNE